ncbi:hypothetical protein F4821DRAFT_245591 [Hypoxylon rubiginosum]|uniref:Uncharacterized protein n=1 Tax=Hypoxylon rubiginosum TaxID=110542 RepID=A0ACC0CSL7_9PEZI|nr:hypothetical protein F4821DRAFT_245591 [Hypoxylon rubiginosum]
MAQRQVTSFAKPFIPDVTRLFEFRNGTMSSAFANNGAVDSRTLSYENSDLNDITRRQMVEDINAYRYDLDFCRTQLNAQELLTPQESRTLQIRVLDCSHNIRHCQHRIELIDAQARNAARNAAQSAALNYRPMQQHRASTGTLGSMGGVKRQRVVKAADSDDDEAGDSIGASMMDLKGTGTSSVQRLGFWKCRLCTSQKYLDAGANRVPSMPCKWPLKDVSKLLNHFLDMHVEHTPEERCKELGAALARNRGPFEYWLTRTRAQEIEDTSVIDEFVNTLQSGALPDVLRGLNRAAGAFPNSVSGTKR